MKNLKYLSDNRSKLLQIITLAALFAAVPCTKWTQAYLTDSEQVQNVFSPNNVQIEIYEKFTGGGVSPEEIDEDANEETDYQQISYDKQVQITNEGDAECFVRVYLNFSNSDVREYSLLSYGDPNDDTDDTNYYSFDEFCTAVSAHGWEYNEDDGYFYYKDKLKPNGTTETYDDNKNLTKDTTKYLLYAVKTNYPYEVSVSGYDIIVYAEAVQAIAEDGSEYTKCQDAFEYFTEESSSEEASVD